MDAFRAAVLCLCFKLTSCLLGNTRDTSVMHEKAKCFLFIYMQPQKVKFKFVQINMKQVSYRILLGYEMFAKKKNNLEGQKYNVHQYIDILTANPLQ